MMRILLFLLGLSVCFVGWSQGNVVTGKITTSVDGTGLPGANVLVKGTARGVVTDIDGNYRIEAGDGSTLVISFIGFVTQELDIGSRSVINVELKEDSKVLGEVIVVGYGETRKEALTGSVTAVGRDKIDQIVTPSLQEALQGNAPGVQVVAQDGTPGAGISVRVRGIGSITGGNEPLYVIDGIPISADSEAIGTTDFDNGGRSANLLASINPNDIESLVVLKDAASTAIYGSRGANGVVLITTKNGSAGKPQVNVKSQWGFSSFAFQNLLEGLTEPEYRELYIEGFINNGTVANEQEGLERYNNQFPDRENNKWLDVISQTGFTQEYDASVSGSKDGLSYFTSINYFDQEGVIKENQFERYSGRLNLKLQVNDKLSIANNLSVSYFEQRGITDGTRWQAPLYLSYLMAPTIPIRDDEGLFYSDHRSFFMGGNHPLGQLFDDRREREQTRFINTLSASYEILPNLVFKSAWSFDILNIDDFIYVNPRYGDGRNVGGSAQEATVDQINWLGSQTLSYNTNFGSDHTLDLLVGYEAQKIETDQVDIDREGFAHPSLVNVSNAANPDPATFDSRSEYAFNSVFGRANYTYKGRYSLSTSLRSDGSSRFGPENRWGTFWSVGGAWTITEESFLTGNDYLNYLKLRSSYGVTGNADIDNYPWADTYQFESDYAGNPGGRLAQVGDPTLTWESQELFNVAIDFGGIFNRITGSIEYFERVSSDLILEDPRSRTSGILDITTNVGDMKNTGWEIALSGDIVSTSDLQVTLGGNITFLENEITKLNSAIVDTRFRREEGRDFQEFYLYSWAGVDPANGNPLWYTDETKSETTNEIGEAVRFYDGKSATPDFFGGVNLDVSWKGISLAAQFNYQFGNYVYDNPGWVIHGDGRFTPRSTSKWAFDNRWTTPGQEALFPQFAWGNPNGSSQQNQDRYLFEGDFIRMRTLRLGYEVPTGIIDKVFLSRLNVYMNLNNFWTWVKDDNLHFDPEQTVNGIYNTVTPIPRTINFGLQATFK